MPTINVLLHKGQSVFSYAMSTNNGCFVGFFLSTDLLYSVRVSKPKQIFAHPDCNPWSSLVLSSSVFDRATARSFCALGKLDEPALPNIGASGQCGIPPGWSARGLALPQKICIIKVQNG